MQFGFLLFLVWCIWQYSPPPTWRFLRSTTLIKGLLGPTVMQPVQFQVHSRSVGNFLSSLSPGWYSQAALSGNSQSHINFASTQRHTSGMKPSMRRYIIQNTTTKVMQGPSFFASCGSFVLVLSSEFSKILGACLSNTAALSFSEISFCWYFLILIFLIEFKKLPKAFRNKWSFS